MGRKGGRLRVEIESSVHHLLNKINFKLCWGGGGGCLENVTGGLPIASCRNAQLSPAVHNGWKLRCSLQSAEGH